MTQNKCVYDVVFFTKDLLLPLLDTYSSPSTKLSNLVTIAFSSGSINVVLTVCFTMM